MQVSERLIDLLRTDVPTVVLTGAGVSAESGIPTFRGGDGLWDKFKPQELASVDAFMRNPKLVWEWYLFRRKIVTESKPNRGHEILAEMEKRLKGFTLVTQNVDNLHQQAGSRQVIELHGNIRRNKCLNCDEQIGDIEIDPEQLPRCACGGAIRPDVVWFGEMLPQEALEEATSRAAHSQLFLSIGTSAEVYPAADLPIIAKKCGAYLVEINPTETVLTPYVDEAFQGKSGEILPMIWRAVNN